MKRICVLTFALLLAAREGMAADKGSDQEVQSNLKAGVAKLDITPPPDTPVTGHPRKTSGVRDPIRAAILLLDDGKTKAAIATFDLLGASDALVKTVRDGISSKAGVPRENILVAASHNHSGPDFEKQEAWAREVVGKVAAAAAEAASDMRPVTVGYGEDTIGFGIN